MNRQVIKNRIRKIFAYTAAGVSFVLISAFLALQIPAVQEALVSRYLRGLSQVTGFRSTVGDFRLLWFDRLEIDDLRVYDPDDNTMIAARRLRVNFDVGELLSGRNVNIDGVSIDSALVFLTRIESLDTARDLNINLFVRRLREQFAAKEEGGQNARINIGEAILNQSVFRYVDQDRDSVKTGFNYNQFSVDIDEAQLRQFTILGDTTEFRVNTLLATDRQSKLRVREMSSFFRLSQQRMEFTDLRLLANQSVIRDSIIFNFNSQLDLSNFIEKVRIEAHLKNTLIQPADLALFAPQVSPMSQPINLSGEFNGYVNDFRVTGMEVDMGNTALRGSLDMEGLPDLQETFIILNLDNSHLDFADLSFAISDKLVSRITPIGTVTLDGQFLGYPTDFVANGTFSGSLGRIRSDINFKVNEENFDRSVYSGSLALENFDLGTYLNDTTNFQRVSLAGKIRGSGLSLSSADFVLNGKASSFGIRGYNYTNIETDARFASELFEGFVRVDDPNLEFTARGSVDLRNKVDLIQIDAQLDTAWLHNLKLTDQYVFLQSAVNINTQGLHIDSLKGTADLEQLTVHYEDQSLNLPNIHLEAQRNAGRRALLVTSPLVDANMRGDFLLSDISRDIQKLITEILLNIRNDQEEIATYYATRNYRPKSYEADFEITLKDIAPIADLLDVDLQLARETFVEGQFTSGYTTIIQAYTHIDTLAYGGRVLVNTDAELTASKIADSTSVLAMAFMHSERQLLSEKLVTQGLVAEAIWNKSHIDFQLDADQEGQNNFIRFRGEVDFLKDSTLIHLLPSTINLLDKRWEVDPRNLITWDQRNIGIQNLIFRQEDEFVFLNGRISEHPDDKLSMEISNLDLSFLSSLTNIGVEGRLGARFELTDYYHQVHLQNDVHIDSLTVDGFLIGDITGRNLWDTARQNFQVDFFIDRHARRIVDLKGVYTPSDEISPLAITAHLKEANLRIVEPFFDYMFSDIGGSITGDYRITGKLQAPFISGEGQVRNGRLRINYLNTTYDFTGIIGLSPNSIYFKDIDVTDAYLNKAKLNGTITHEGFRNTRINLASSFTNFHLLNTTARDNSLFYGQGFGTGDLAISGPVSNLKFTASARTDRNTRIYIPIGDDRDLQQKEFIRFVSFNDSSFQQQISDNIPSRLDLSGITLDFNIDVTDDAYCEILLNDQAGDKIYGRGNGELQLQLDTKGEFNMFGPFEFTEGYYRFTLYDLINKEFEINKGSRITWYGDAYEGTLDIDATYNQSASLAPILLDEKLRAAPQLKRKYPVQVLIQLDGPMLSPDINFDIVAQDLPQSVVVDGVRVGLDFEFQAFKNRMDEQELKRQVFSLIVLRRISPPESFNTTGSDVINSVSELFSNQLSNFVSQVDENLEIDVDFSRMDEEEFNTFQLRLSYTFFNGRLRVTRDGTFYSGQDNAYEQNLSTLAGDWMVDYILTPDGKLKIKMYNRTNINPIFNTPSSQNSSITTGFSISHTQSFNELRELWNARKKEDEEADDNDADSSKEARREENQSD